MARKTSKEYLTEHNNLQAKLSALESRIENRAKQMVKKQPDVRFIEDNPFITVQEMMDTAFNEDRETRTSTYIDIIKAIEDHNLKQSRIVQKTIYDDL